MFRYYAWALAEKTLSYIPFGDKLYELAGYVAFKDSKGTTSAFTNSFRMIRKAKELLPANGTVIDVGTGWYHHDAFLLWLIGDYKVYLFDVADKARTIYIKNYLKHLQTNTDILVRELDIDRNVALDRLDLLIQLRDRSEIYNACKFVPCIITDPTRPFLPDDSIDFMISSCVLCHVSIDILTSELMALRRMLKPNGRMYILIGHEDDVTWHDHSVNLFNFYRYSDKYYELIFHTKFEYQNRLVKHEWLDLFKQVGLRVEEYQPVINDHTRGQIAVLPHIDSRFALYPQEELAIMHSYFLLRK